MNSSSKSITKTIICIGILNLFGCKKNPIVKQEKNTVNGFISTVKDTTNYHVDTSYQYETRTGTSNNYKYTYDVIGFDSNQNEITGTISIEGKYGTGLIIVKDQNKIQVDVEWTGHGKLKAIDKQSNEYELIVE